MIDSLAIGRFDGIHLGHRALFERLTKDGAILAIETGRSNLTPPEFIDKYVDKKLVFYRLEEIKDLDALGFLKKLKKLKNNPKLFFKDMLEKRFNKYEIFLKKFAKKKKNGYSQYTVVSAVYNVDKYLDDYFESLISQNLNFINNIYLILVDDGSTDNSAQIIKKWQKKYPKNINYIYKENGGQASARNLGLEYVTTDWVTFIDPDDFVDPNYFLALDDYIFINKDKDIKMIGCNLVFYYEDLNVYKNTHPLRYKFNMGNKLIKLENLKNNV